MSAPGSRLDDSGYLNWVRSTLGLLYLKEGLHGVTDTKVDELYDKISQDVLDSLSTQQAATGSMLVQSCSTCTSDTFKKKKATCPLHICDTWFNEIVTYHIDHPHQHICASNFDPCQWSDSSKQWEVAKVFMPFGCENCNQAEDCDPAAILSLWKNCHYLHGFVDDQKVNEVQEIRHRLMHSRDYRVEDSQFQGDMTIMIELLESLKGLSHTQGLWVQHAIDRIKQLKTNRVDLTLNLEVRALKATMIALEGEQRQLERSLDQQVQDLRSTTEDLQSQMQEYQQTKDDVKEFKQMVDLFITFIKAAGLEQLDFERINTLANNLATLGDKLDNCEQMLINLGLVLTEHERKLEHHDKKLMQLEATMKQHGHVEASTNRPELETESPEIHQKRSRDEDKSSRDTNTSSVQPTQTIEDVCVDLEVQPWTPSIQNVFLSQVQVQAQSPQQQGILGRLYGLYQWMSGYFTKPKEEEIRKDEPCVSCSYKDSCRDLQQHLISRYQKMRILGFPLCSMSDKLYSRGNIPTLRIYSLYQRGLNILHKLPHKKKYDNRFIKGDAGVGKTILCKGLAFTWSQAFQNIKRELGEDYNMKRISDFKFLFYLSMRDVTSETCLEDIIRHQLLHNIQFNVNISDILKSETCLIILDGIDEWSCTPTFGLHDIRDLCEINNTFDGCTLIVTSRSWAFDLMDLKMSNNDFNHQLSDHIDDSDIIADLLNQNFPKKVNVEEYLSHMKSINLEDCVYMPFCMIPSMILWYNGKDVGCTKLDIFKNALMREFEEARKKNQSEEDDTNSKQSNNTTQDRHYKAIIAYLSEIAFNHLFPENKDRRVSFFEGSTLKRFGLESIDIDVCLQTGVLVKTTVYNSTTDEVEYFKFSERWIQEALAATFIASSTSDQSVFTRVEACCSTLPDILEKFLVLIFLSSIKPVNVLFKHVSEVIAKDMLVRKYRESLCDSDVITAIQSCAVKCYDKQASDSDTDATFFLEDFVISWSILSDTDLIEPLLKQNRTRIKSVFIRHESVFIRNAIYIYPTTDIDLVSKARNAFAVLLDLRGLQKLCIADVKLLISYDDIATLIHNSTGTLKCLRTNVSEYHEQCFKEIYNSISSLCALDLQINLPHKQFKDLLFRISQTKSFAELKLNVSCIDHRYPDPCRYELDLEGFSQVRILEIHSLCIVVCLCSSVQNIQTIAASIEYLRVSHSSLKESVLCAFIEEVSNRNKEVNVELRVSIVRDSNTLESALRNNKRLKLGKFHGYDSEDGTWFISFRTTGQRSADD